MSLRIYAFKREHIQPGHTGRFTWLVGDQVCGVVSYAFPKRSVEAGLPVSEIVLYYNGEYGGLSQRVRLVWTECHYGGKRPWFLCPGCESQRGVLFHARELWMCRSCLKLTYTSQHESEADRALRKALKLRRRLGQEWGGIGVPIPCHPERMHGSTYKKIRRAIVEAEDKYFRLSD